MAARPASPRGSAGADLRAGLRDGAFYLLASLLGRGALLLAVPFLARAMPLEDFGRFDLMLATITLGCAALLMGTDSAAASTYAACDKQDRDALQAVFDASCATPLVGGALLAALLGVAQLLGLASAASAATLWIALACALVLALCNCLIGLLRWTERAGAASVLLAAAGALPALGALAGAMSSSHADAFFLAQAGLLGGYVLALGACLAWGPQVAWARTFGHGLHLAAFARHELARAWMLGLASLALPARKSLERLAVLALLGETALAGYAVLLRLAQVTEIALQGLGNGFYPRALRTLGEPEGQQQARQALGLYLAATLGAVLLATLSGRWLVPWFGGPEFANLWPLLPLAVAGAALAALPYCAGMAFFHRQRLGAYAALLLASAASALATAVLGSVLLGSLAGWLCGAAAGSALAGIAFLIASERVQRVGYSLAATVVALILMGVLCAVAPKLS